MTAEVVVIAIVIVVVSGNGSSICKDKSGVVVVERGTPTHPFFLLHHAPDEAAHVFTAYTKVTVVLPGRLVEVGCSTGKEGGEEREKKLGHHCQTVPCTPLIAAISRPKRSLGF